MTNRKVYRYAMNTIRSIRNELYLYRRHRLVIGTEQSVHARRAAEVMPQGARAVHQGGVSITPPLPAFERSRNRAEHLEVRKVWKSDGTRHVGAEHLDMAHPAIMNLLGARRIPIE